MGIVGFSSRFIAQTRKELLTVYRLTVVKPQSRVDSRLTADGDCRHAFALATGWPTLLKDVNGNEIPGANLWNFDISGRLLYEGIYYVWKALNDDRAPYGWTGGDCGVNSKLVRMRMQRTRTRYLSHTHTQTRAVSTRATTPRGKDYLPSRSSSTPSPRKEARRC
jgi:hypothetical protein